MKKFLKISAIVIGIIILLMIILPFLFKDQIVELVKNEANKNLNATVNFEDVGLNLFSSFPDLSLSLDELTIINKAPFEGDTLLTLNEFNASVDIWSVISGDQIRIKSVNLEQPNIYIYVLEDSTANYNIMKEDTTAIAETDTSAGELNIALKKYSIENGNIAYLDQTGNMTAVIRNLNHSGSGDFSKDNFTLETETTIDELTFEKSGIKYLNNSSFRFDMNIDADMSDKKFTFKENELQLNNLILKFDGFVAMPEESIEMDLAFSSVDNSFKNIISLIPAVYTENFEDLEASGEMSLTGKVQGEYSEENLPKINIDLSVENGMFKYPELPTPVNNVNMNMNVNNPGGTADNTIINMKNLHFEIGNEPFDARLLVRNPVSTPYIDTEMKGKIDLGQLKNALYMEDVTELSGIISADFKAEGNIANADQKTIENLSAAGNISFNNIIYGSNSLPENIQVKSADLLLTPKQFNLNNFLMQVGKSNLRAEGSLQNVISYVLSDGTIQGNLNLSSDYFDVNPFLSEKKETEEAQTDTARLEAPSVPENINFTMNSNFKTIIYDNLTLENVKGTIVVANQRIALENLSMNTLGGSIVADGYYQKEEETPEILFNLTIKNLNFKNTYKSFVTVQRFAPMAQYIEGSFDSRLSMNTSLDQSMQPVWDSFNGTGSLAIQKAAIQDFKPLNIVGDKLNIAELKDPSLDNVSTNFTIENGRLHISPFDFKVLGYNVTVAGSNGIDQSIDYAMGIDIPASNLKQQGNKAISNLLGRNLEVIQSGTIEVKADIKGTIQDPDVSVAAGDIVEETTKQVTEEVKKEVQKQIEAKKEEVEEKVKEEVKEKVDTVKSKIKKEAEKKLRDLFK